MADNNKGSTPYTTQNQCGSNSVQPVGRLQMLERKFPSVQIMCTGIELICSRAHVVNTHVHTQRVTIKFQEDDLDDLDDKHNFPHWLAHFMSQWLQVYFRSVSACCSEVLAHTVSLFQLIYRKERQRILHFVDSASRHRFLLITNTTHFLRYNPEVREFDSRWCHWNYSLT